jgi:hypothetical protein
MNLSNTYKIPSTVTAKPIGTETVILDLASGTYFGLDPVGARLWQLIEEGNSLAKVCDIMQEEYDVSRDLLERDAFVLVGELIDKKLISLAEI